MERSEILERLTGVLRTCGMLRDDETLTEESNLERFAFGDYRELYGSFLDEVSAALGRKILIDRFFWPTRKQTGLPLLAGVYPLPDWETVAEAINYLEQQLALEAVAA